ncbi:alpha/beta hydrolase [Halomonas heilongjiangensis]|uniref:Esterase n=1 Tax=Halomonas heilongjiangensis TaxID=1387883 RepID=A0A2N7TTW5_9GAMM|nr:alpha/beta hydrolase-fold protein [Halomonas heilongjiangensis]PMR71632.1 esterase [Halomonas heilongjiangensis]PXX87199.1 esterase [Halomonas heilongjiangensis]
MKEGLRCCAMLLVMLAGQALAGQVTHHRFHSETLGRDYPYTLYLPDGYHESGLEYPVLYLLHGSFGNDQDWVNRGALKAVADRLIRQGRIPPTVIVMPGSHSWWIDGHNENARSAFLDDLLPHVEALWRVVPEREWRAVAGLSAGGYGTVNFILERPELFAAAAALSPASYHPLPPANSTAREHAAFLTPEGRFDADLWQRLNYPAYLDSYLAQEYVVPLYLSAGNRDAFDAVRHARKLQLALEEHQPGQVPFEVFRGGHTWRVWRASLPGALTFLFRYLQPPRPLGDATHAVPAP